MFDMYVIYVYTKLNFKNTYYIYIYVLEYLISNKFLFIYSIYINKIINNVYIYDEI